MAEQGGEPPPLSQPPEGVATAVPPAWLPAMQSLLDRADSSDSWVRVATRGTTINAEQWWHSMHAWTSGRSFMRSVWRVDVDEDFPTPDSLQVGFPSFFCDFQ